MAVILRDIDYKTSEGMVCDSTWLPHRQMRASRQHNMFRYDCVITTGAKGSSTPIERSSVSNFLIIAFSTAAIFNSLISCHRILCYWPWLTVALRYHWCQGHYPQTFIKTQWKYFLHGIQWVKDLGIVWGLKWIACEIIVQWVTTTDSHGWIVD